jgi:hypothetical protein
VPAVLRAFVEFVVHAADSSDSDRVMP